MGIRTTSRWTGNPNFRNDPRLETSKQHRCTRIKSRRQDQAVDADAIRGHFFSAPDIKHPYTAHHPSRLKAYSRAVGKPKKLTDQEGEAEGGDKGR